MRSAHRRGLEHALFHHTGAKKLLDQPEDIAVRHLGGDRFQNDGLRQIIEEPYDRLPTSATSRAKFA